MWSPPDLGKQYVRELERKQREEAYLRQGHTGRRSHLPGSRLLGSRLGIGQKLAILGVAVVAVTVALLLVSALASPPTG